MIHHITCQDNANQSIPISTLKIKRNDSIVNTMKHEKIFPKFFIISISDNWEWTQAATFLAWSRRCTTASSPIRWLQNHDCKWRKNVNRCLTNEHGTTDFDIEKKSKAFIIQFFTDCSKFIDVWFFVGLII